LTEQKPRKRRAKKKNLYFTEVHQKAIVEYALTDCRKVRTDLYIQYIGPVFDEMVDKITYTYKFTTLPNIDVLKDECKIWLTTILDKFDPEKGSKAFSYFSVITKNWFIHKVKKNSKNLKKEVNYDDVVGELEQTHLSEKNEYLDRREKFEFWQSLMNEFTMWEKQKLKENERKVLNAIIDLFDNVDELEIFNKKAIYMHIRELTNLNTKQVVNNLNRLREKYRNFKKDYNRDI
jgi:hypothetical protein